MYKNSQLLKYKGKSIAAPAVSVRTTIDDLPFDVLVLIFQQSVKQEAAEQRKSFPTGQIVQEPLV
jgi:hypothetical protein